MDHYRRTAHTKFDIKLHFVWITKYRKPLLRGEVGQSVRRLTRQICSELEVEIIKGHVSHDHVHLYCSVPPRLSPSQLMQRIKGKTSRRLMQDFEPVRRACWGRHVWARGFFVVSSGNVTDEIIREYIENQDLPKDDDDFRVSDESPK